MAENKKKKKKAEPTTEPPSPPSLLDRLKRRFRVFLVVGVVLAVTVWSALPHIGRFLVVNDELEPADALVVLSGDRGERLEYAFGLYDAGLADLFILTGGPLYADLSEADLLRRHAVMLGVPETKIIMETEAVNTYQNARNTRELMERYGLESAVVVSSPYHMRRVSILFDEVFAGSDIRLVYAPAGDSWFDPNHWWETSGGRRLVVSEYAKLAVLVLPERWRSSSYERGRDE
ncbi:MAG: YdcF family protein [Candidatus Desulforudis sp.]|nr:YdcF family protein [Desulforudis sp.]